MAAINRAEIPDAALNSMDALSAWIETAMDEAYAGQSLVREAPNVSNPPIVIGEFKDLDGIYRLSSRSNLRLAPGYQASRSPIWENVIPIANLELPLAWRKS